MGGAPTAVIPAVKWSYAVNLPVLDPSVHRFSFQTSLPDRAFTFTFKFIGPVPEAGEITLGDAAVYDAMDEIRGLGDANASMGAWYGWCQLPSGETRPFGCIPDVCNWTAFPDYGVVLHNSAPVLGPADLFRSTLYVLAWEN